MLSDNDSEYILIELSNGEIEAHRLFYKSLNQIEFVYVHLYLKNQLRWNWLMMDMTENEVAQISDRCKMTFYRHRTGKAANKTIVGITGIDEYTMFIMSLEESLNDLRECLEESTLIKWNRLPLCVAVHHRFHKMI